MPQTYPASTALTSSRLCLAAVGEPQLRLLAEFLAFMVQPGDLITLSGDLGAGKTTFARGFIRALMRVDGGDDAGQDIPSPTYTLAQTYPDLCCPVTHFDLYRLSAPEDLRELGLEVALKGGAALVEWPDLGAGELPEAAFAITLDDGAAAEMRDIRIEAGERGAERLTRLQAMWALLASHGVTGETHQATPLTGDASTRRYARLRPTAPEAIPLLLMDWPAQPDGPPVHDGQPYSRIAHIAEDVRAFVAVQDLIKQNGTAVPAIHAADLDAGLLLLQDFGDGVFARLVAGGADQEQLWSAALDVLINMRPTQVENWDAPDYGITYRPASYDRTALQIEVGLLLDWAYPLFHGRPADDETRGTFAAAWAPILDALHRDETTGDWCLTLRDFHSPNLIWREDAACLNERVGVIDFQDAVNGPPMYDVVSLLQDARTDVPADLESRLLARYIASVLDDRKGDDPRDEAFLRRTYAFCGTQRATKILGIFCRLATRDGKPGYLAHLPRIWGYLERNLAHPDLSVVRAWYDTHIPTECRRVVLPAPRPPTLILSKPTATDATLPS